MKGKLLSLILALVTMLGLLCSSAAAAYTESCTGNCAHQAQIGTTHYDTLNEAIDAVGTGTTATTIELIGPSDTYPLPTGNAYTNSMTGKTIIFKADQEKNKKIDGTNFNVNGTQNLIGANLTFEGVTVEFHTDSSWHQNNPVGLNLANGTLVYDDCTIIGCQYLYTDTVKFIDCVFENQTTSTYDWDSCVYTYAGKDVLFQRCVFNTNNNAVYVSNDYAVTSTITFDDCTFNYTGQGTSTKAAVECSPTDNNPDQCKFTVIFKEECDTEGYSENASLSPLYGNDRSMDSSHLEVHIDDEEVTAPLYVEKKEAKADIDQAVQDAKAAIDAMDNLTDAEKDAAKAEVDKAANEAKQAVTNADTEADLNQAKVNGEAAIDKAVDDAKALADAHLNAAQDAAKTEIDKAAEDAKAAIDAMGSLTDEEKEAAKAEIDKAAEEAKEAVDNAATAGGVDQAAANGETALDKIVDDAGTQNADNLTDAKADAKTAIDQTAQDAKNEIDAMGNLTDAEKDALKSAIDDAAGKAKAEIDAAGTADAVNQAKGEGTAAVKQTVTDAATDDLAAAKAAAAGMVDKMAAVEKAAIDALANLSDAEKQAHKDAIDAAAAAAKDAIGKAATPDEIAAAKERGLDATGLIGDKAAMIDAVKAAATGNKAGINAMAQLTAQKKAELLAAADAQAQAAIAAIDAAGTAADAIAAKDAAIAAIGKLAADAAVVTVKIVGQPAAQQAMEGQPVAFSVDAQGEGLTYQWQIDRGDGKGWAALPGETGAGHAIAAAKLEYDGYQYRCIVTDKHGRFAVSEAAALAVAAMPVIPQTGDGSQLALWCAMLALCGGAALLRRRRTA